MKKIYALAVCVFTLMIANAQITKGSIFLGGDIGGSSYKTETMLVENTQKTFTVSPVVGIAIRENLILGTELLYGHSKSNTGPEQSIDAYGIGAFMRKYKVLGKSGFYLFLQGRTAYRYARNKIVNAPGMEATAKNHSINLGLYPGISYAVSKKLHLETGFNNLVSVQWFTEKSETTGGSLTDAESSGINFNSSLNNISNLYLGFRLLLTK